VHIRGLGNLAHHVAKDAFWHDQPSDPKGTLYTHWRLTITRPIRMRMANKSQKSFILAMIAAMSTKTPTYLIKRELDTKPETDENDNADGTGSRTRHQSGARAKRTNNTVSTVRTSTTSRTEKATIVRGTPAAPARIIRSSGYPLPTISTSGVSRNSSMVTHRATTSAVRRSSP